MKLKYLSVQGYKNLKNVTIDFSGNNGTTLLLGNNGCGKSNILEALSAIFAGLYKDRKFKPEFDYQIEYELNSHIVNISLQSGTYHILVDSKSLSKSEFSANANNLPSNLIACYSGESMRLWDSYYWMYYRDYIESVKKSAEVPRLPLVYINKYTLEFALLVLFSYDFTIFTDISDFCQNTLGIKSIKFITFIFNKSSKIEDWNLNPILNFVMALCGVDEMSKIPSQIGMSLDEYKENTSYLQTRERDMFYFLFGAYMPKDDKIITNIILDLELKNGDIIRVDSLSEGEKKNILIMTILEVLADENSLILLDEPDSHIHISRKQELKDTIAKYPNRESIWTTHSPTLASAFEVGNHIVGLGVDENNKTRIIAKPATELISEITNGIWNIHQQNVFLSSNKPMTVLVEGKTDKIHILEAWSRLKKYYSNLDFDVFAMNSSEHIREVLIGMSCSEISWNKKFVGIFDNDSAGARDITNGFEAEEKGSSIKHVKYKYGVPSTSFYAFLLPKYSGYDPKESFTIENMYPAEKYEDAYVKAVNDKRGFFKFLSIDTIADDIKNKSKIIMASNVHDYNDIDFELFKKIFDLLEEINNK